MKLLVTVALLAGLLSTAIMSQVIDAAAAIPCEQSLATLRAAEQDKWPAADVAKFDRLKAEGIARCNEDDDVGADELFKQAQAMLSR
jgi:hypothetical protein